MEDPTQPLPHPSLVVECPYCGAEPGHPCQAYSASTQQLEDVRPHRQRRTALDVAIQEADAARAALEAAELAASNSHELLQAYLQAHPEAAGAEVPASTLQEYAQRLQRSQLQAEGQDQALDPAERTDFPPPHLKLMVEVDGTVRASVFAGACSVAAAVVNGKRAHALSFGVPNGQVDVYLTEGECRSLWEYLGTHLAKKRLVVTGRMPTPPSGGVRHG